MAQPASGPAASGPTSDTSDDHGPLSQLSSDELLELLRAIDRLRDRTSSPPPHMPPPLPASPPVLVPLHPHPRPLPPRRRGLHRPPRRLFQP